MNNFQSKPQLLNTKLIALWAVSESGLGGLLHAIKIPFSGLFLGSFAVIIITYIAYTNTNRFNTIIKATLLVILIKAIASPHSPPMAYVAVLFQGTIGAIIYGTFGVNRLTAISFGAIALFESAFQKILTLTIIFGMGLWESIQTFFKNIQEQLQADWIADLPWLFLIAYGIIYAFIGAVAGNLSIKLPKKVYENVRYLQTVDYNSDIENIDKKKHKKRKLWLISGLLLFSVFVFLFSGSFNNALYIILRTVGAIVFFLFVFNPLFKYLFNIWVKKQQKAKKETLNNIIDLMPTIRSNASLAQQLSKPEKNLWRRGKSFIINWLSLSLYSNNDEEK